MNYLEYTEMIVISDSRKLHRSRWCACRHRESVKKFDFGTTVFSAVSGRLLPPCFPALIFSRPSSENLFRGESGWVLYEKDGCRLLRESRIKSPSLVVFDCSSALVGLLKLVEMPPVLPDVLFGGFLQSPPFSRLTYCREMIGVPFGRGSFQFSVRVRACAPRGLMSRPDH